MKNTYFYILFTATALQFSCSNQQSSSRESDTNSSFVDTKNEALELEEFKKDEAERIKREASLTTMSFDKTTINFGKIKEDTENNATFKVTNTGKYPLIIDKVDVSCGCTTAKKPEKPIAPGMSDVIDIVFHPKVGQLNEQKKTVTITANTNPKVEVLNIEAFVTK